MINILSSELLTVENDASNKIMAKTLHRDFQLQITSDKVVEDYSLRKQKSS